MSVIARLSEYIKLRKFSVNKFESELGFSNGIIAKAIRGGKTIGSDKLERIFQVYIDLNPTWLLTGNGEMILTDEKKRDTEVSGIGDCENCERLKEKIDMLQQLLESKTETIRAYQSNESSNTDSTESKGRNSA